MTALYCGPAFRLFATWAAPSISIQTAKLRNAAMDGEFRKVR